MDVPGRRIIFFSEPQGYIYSGWIDVSDSGHFFIQSTSSLSDILNQPHLTNVKKSKYNILQGYILIRDVKIISVSQKSFREFTYCTVKVNAITFAYDAEPAQYKGSESLRKASQNNTLGYIADSFHFRDFFSIEGQRINVPNEGNKNFVGLMNPSFKGSFLGYPIEKYEKVVGTLPSDFCVVNKEHRAFRMLKK